jgi:hypothetical protein
MLSVRWLAVVGVLGAVLDARAQLAFVPETGYAVEEVWRGANVAHLAVGEGSFYLYGAEDVGGGLLQSVVWRHDGEALFEIARTASYGAYSYFPDAITVCGNDLYWVHAEGAPDFYATIMKTWFDGRQWQSLALVEAMAGLTVFSLCTNGAQVFGTGFSAAGTHVAFFLDEQDQYRVFAELPALASGGSGFDPAGSFYAGAYGYDYASYMYQYTAQQVADRVSGVQALPYTAGDAVAVHVVPDNGSAVMESDGYRLFGVEYNATYTGTNPYAFTFASGASAPLGQVVGAATTVAADVHHRRGWVILLAKNDWSTGSEAVVYRVERDTPPYATVVVEVDRAPGQWVNDPNFNDPARMLGWPLGDDPNQPNPSSLFSLGGFGGTVVLGFDRTVWDDPANPFGLDAIVYGNAMWVGGDPNRRFAECATIEVSRDLNFNGLADDPWYLIQGSHIARPGYPAVFEVHTWDDDIPDPTHPPHFPPADPSWIPPEHSGVWTSEGYRLPGGIFEAQIVENPNGPTATEEGIYGYADFSPTLGLPGGMAAGDFFTRPDNPFAVGLTPGSGGGDAIDVAWAVDAVTWASAGLDGIDFVRIRTAVDFVLLNPPLGELSTEVDAVVDVAAGRLGDAENDGDIDIDDLRLFVGCVGGPDVAAPTSPCRVMSFDFDSDVDLRDVSRFQVVFGVN